MPQSSCATSNDSQPTESSQRGPAAPGSRELAVWTEPRAQTAQQRPPCRPLSSLQAWAWAVQPGQLGKRWAAVGQLLHRNTEITWGGEVAEGRLPIVRLDNEYYKADLQATVSFQKVSHMCYYCQIVPCDAHGCALGRWVKGE